MPSTLLSPPNTRGNFPDLLERGVRNVFTLNYPRWDQGLLENIYTVTDSVKQLETDVVTAYLGTAPVKPEGAVVAFDAMQETWKATFTHLTYALAVEFTEESIEDNLYLDLIDAAGQALARAMAYTRQVQAFDIFNNLALAVYTVPGTTGGISGGAGYPLLSTTQFLLAGGSSWANRPTNAVGLSQEALEERLQAWTTNMVDQRGLKTNTRPKILMVGAADEFLATRIVNSTYRAQSADNDINPVKENRDLTVFMNPHMTDDGRWYLIAPQADTALIQFDRVKAGVKRWDAGDTGNLKIRARMRISHGAAHVTGVMGSPGS